MKRFPIFMLVGALLLLLGGAVILGWFLHLPSVVHVAPSFTPMVFNTALCFFLSGTVLVTPYANTLKYRQITTLIGGVLVIISTVTLSEHALNPDLVIDWPALHAWLNETNPRQGRMSIPTACGFFLTGLTVLFAPRVGLTSAGTLVRLTTLGVSVIGVFGLAGYLVHAQLLFPEYPFAGVAVHTSIGFILLAIGLWSAWQRLAWAQVPLFAREDDRITFVGAAIMAVIAIAAGISSFAILQHQVQAVVGNNLMASLTRRVETFQDFIHLREVNARIAATRPAVLRNLRALQSGRGTSSDRENLNAVVASFLQQEFRAIAFYDSNGKEVASGGVFAQDSPMVVKLATQDKAELLWADEFVLRHRLPLRDADGQVGTVLVEQSLPVLTRLLRDTPTIGGSGDVGLCVARQHEMQCFPQRLNPRVFTVPIVESSAFPLPMTFALNGKTGVLVTRDYRGKNVIAAYGPVGNLGLGLVVKVDTAEAFLPIREDLQFFLVVLLAFVLGGTLLLRAQIKPLVAKLIYSTTTLHENKEQFHTVVSGIKDYAVIMLDNSGHILSWNAGAERIKGYCEDEIVGQHFSRFYLQSDIESGKPELELKKVTETGRFEEDGWRLRKDGSQFWANVVITALRDATGQMRGFVKITRDITERNRFEHELREKNIELERASRAKDLFLAGMSHELRTPLNAIIGFTGTLLMKLPGPLLPEQDKQLRTVQNSARHLLSLINDLLDMAKIDADKLELELGDVDCNRVLEEVADFLRPEAERKGLSFTVQLQEKPRILHTDRRALSQIIINLAGNAVKFTEQGSVRVWMDEIPAVDGNVLNLKVEDTGLGIREQDQARLFEAFSRIQSTDRRKHEGTGLGLHLSRKLAERLGGRITFQSEYGKGSTFTLELPGT